ncbi:hypothetical protein LPJ73_000974 [Coemansia sp. RSA 2703]|nr:hypothetical protein LPJ73_000974 [Coemansia sp. RSA 2703]KAJ2376904.1 hypothetical protein IW150_001700 [Coemansia sp. RSA 2607]KAJ2397603.1 hypothetical protein GGI05_000561 [Coemansia sp. RSA 2603]
MDSELKAPARLLSVGTAPNIAAEVAYDLVRRTLSPAPALVRLGQYVATSRILARQAYMVEQRKLEQQQQEMRNIVDSTAHAVAGGISAAFSLVNSSGRYLDSLGPEDTHVLNAVLRACCDAASDERSTVAALALTGGLGVALRRELGAHADTNELVKHAYAAVAQLTYCAVRLDYATVSKKILGDVLGVLGECAPTAACLAALADDERTTDMLGVALFDGSSMNDEDMALGAALLGNIVGTSKLRFVQAERLAAQMHSATVEALVAVEQRAMPCSGALAQAVQHVAECVLRRYYVDDNREQPQRLASTWCLLVDALACVHSATLRLFGRAGGDVFRRATTLAVAFVTDRNLSEDCVKQLFAMQPCLRFTSGLPVGAISDARSATVLFYLDLCEHLAQHVEAHTLVHLVLPLAARYAGSMPRDQMGSDLFESAHAVVLAALEPHTTSSSVRSSVVMQVAPWYAALVLEQHAARALSADLLLIAYTAAVRALAAVKPEDVPQNARYVWDCVLRLLELIPVDGGSMHGDSRVHRELKAARRRELMRVLAELPAAVPVELLPRLLPEIRSRVLASDPGTRDATVSALQDVILVRADVARKPALSAWVMQLRQDSISKL